MTKTEPSESAQPETAAPIMKEVDANLTELSISPSKKKDAKSSSALPISDGPGVDTAAGTAANPQSVENAPNLMEPPVEPGLSTGTDPQPETASNAKVEADSAEVDSVPEVVAEPFPTRTTSTASKSNTSAKMPASVPKEEKVSMTSTKSPAKSSSSAQPDAAASPTVKVDSSKVELSPSPDSKATKKSKKRGSITSKLKKMVSKKSVQ